MSHLLRKIRSVEFMMPNGETVLFQRSAAYVQHMIKTIERRDEAVLVDYYNGLHVEINLNNVIYARYEYED